MLQSKLSSTWNNDMAFSSTKRQTYIKYSLMLATAVFLTLTYIFYRGCSTPSASRIIIILIYIDIILLSLVSICVWWQIRAIILIREPKRGKRPFYRQIIYLFSGIAIVPSICVFIFSILFFNIGVENLFKSPIKHVLENSEKVTTLYVTDITNNLENFVNGLGKQVGKCINEFLIDQQRIDLILNEATNLMKVNASVVQIVGNDVLKIIANTQFAIPAEYEQLTECIKSLDDSDMITWEDNNVIFSAYMIDRNLGVYLVASLPKSPDLLEYSDEMRKAVAEYSHLKTKRVDIQISFMTFFSVITSLLVLTAILAGIIFAKRIMRPINELITAANTLTLDKTNIPIKLEPTSNELSILAKAFNSMMERITMQNKQLVTANRLSAWRDVARKIAHEIKNPLTPIQLSAERIRNKYKKEISNNPEVFDNCIETIIRQVRCIGNLVTEFSDFARMPEPKIERIDIVALIQQSIFIQSNAHRNINFIQRYNPSQFLCDIDPSQINQVIINLTQNAINSITENNLHTSPFDGNIMITLEVNNDTISISIEDDGVGFSDSALENALEPYYTTREHGTGLGLAIVNKIIVDHGGKITLGKSQELGGAKILLKIPCNYLENRGEKNGI